MLRQDVRDRIAGQIVRGPFGELIDMVVEHIDEDACRVRLPLRQALSNGGGVAHGGAIAALVDTAATGAAWATNRTGFDTRGATVGFTVNFLAPGVGENLLAEARVVQRGRSLTILDVTVVDDAGAPIAKGQVTYKLGLDRG